MSTDLKPTSVELSRPDEGDKSSEIVKKLQWLMFLRVVMITLLLGSMLALEGANDPLSTAARLSLLWLIIGTYGLTIVYAVILKQLRSAFETFAYIQLFIDLLCSAAIVSLTGGTESLFLFMFSLTVLNASILLYRRGAMFMSAASTGLIVLLVTRETTGWMLDAPASPAQLRGIFLSGMTNVSAVFFVALLAGYLSEQLRDAGQRLRFARENLEALKTLNEHIITSIQSGLVSYTLDLTVIFFNPAAARITGVEPERILFQKLTDVFPTIAQLRPNPANPLNRWEAEFVRPDSSIRRLGYSLSPLMDNDGHHRGWILNFQDLTHLREMEGTIERSERFAAIGKMAAGIAHEIRNPLASMSGCVEMLSRSDRLDQTEQKLMQIVMRETDRLNALITDFLQYTRPIPPQFEQIELGALLDEVVEIYLHTPGRGPNTVRLDLDRPFNVHADADQLKQIIWNLVRNADQAMADGGIIRLEADRSTLGGTPTYKIRVIDEGCGMDETVKERIFDPFYTTKVKGTGLGLSLVHRMIDEHQGHIRIESQVGHGTTFEIVLPISPSSPLINTAQEAVI